MKELRFYSLVSACIIMVGLNACRKECESGKPEFIFQHIVAEESLVKDSLIYVNMAGNHYEVNELQYFISEVMLWEGRTAHPISSAGGIHYIDIDIPSTLRWTPDDEIPGGTYDSISFIFGINEEKNKSGLFVNPPERDMFWPDMMGGGYHYMKMNGKWLDSLSLLQPFNLHLGIGMITDTLGNDHFIQNFFRVSLPLSNCSLEKSDKNWQFTINMDINSWFQTPYTWDWNVIGGQIMANQDAMHLAVLNGKDAFSVQYIPVK